MEGAHPFAVNIYIKYSGYFCIVSDTYFLFDFHTVIAVGFAFYLKSFRVEFYCVQYAVDNSAQEYQYTQYGIGKHSNPSIVTVNFDGRQVTVNTEKKGE